MKTWIKITLIIIASIILAFGTSFLFEWIWNLITMNDNGFFNDASIWIIWAILLILSGSYFTFVFVKNKSNYDNSHPKTKENYLEKKWIKKIFYSTNKSILDINTYSSFSLASSIKNKNDFKITSILAVDKSCVHFEKSEKKDMSKLVSGSTIIFGAPGSGKTDKIVIPTIISNILSVQKPSMVVLDMKGELFIKTAGFAEKNNYKIHQLNLKNPYRSDKWNPLVNIYEAYFNYANEPKFSIAKSKNLVILENEISLITDLIINSSTEKINKDYFFNQAKIMLKFYLLLYLELYPTKEQYNFFNLSKLMQREALEIYLMVKAINEDALCLRYSGEFNSEKNLATEAFTNIRSITNMIINDFITEEVKQLTNGNDFNYYEIINNPSIVYLIFENESSSKQKLASIFLDQVYNKIQEKIANETAKSNSQLKKPFLYICDEIGNVPKIKSIKPIFTTGRGQNIFVMMVLQSISQLEEIYTKFEARTILDSAMALVCMSTNNLDVAKELSQASGTYYSKRISNQYGTFGDDKGYSTSRQKQTNLEPEAFLYKSKDKVIVMSFSNKPALLQSDNFYKSRIYNQLVDLPLNKIYEENFVELDENQFNFKIFDGIAQMRIDEINKKQKQLSKKKENKNTIINSKNQVKTKKESKKIKKYYTNKPLKKQDIIKEK